jgi:hypothetical protein
VLKVAVAAVDVATPVDPEVGVTDDTVGGVGVVVVLNTTSTQ